jgi:hypothetical protein
LGQCAPGKDNRQQPYFHADMLPQERRYGRAASDNLRLHQLFATVPARRFLQGVADPAVAGMTTIRSCSALHERESSPYLNTHSMSTPIPFRSTVH